MGRRLLVVHHTSSPSRQAMLEAIMAGARTDEVTGVEVSAIAALQAGAWDVLQADGFLLLSPVNIGYVSGALKHFFDQIYYPCLDSHRGAPYGSRCTAMAMPPARCGRWTRSPPDSAGRRPSRRSSFRVLPGGAICRLAGNSGPRWPPC